MNAEDCSYQFTTLASVQEITLYYETELAALGYQIEKVVDPTYTILYIEGDSSSEAV